MPNMSLSGRKIAAILIIQSLFIVPCIIQIFNNHSLNSCTIFSISRDEMVLFCNNEDEGLRHGRVLFSPGTTETFGLVLFGYAIYRDGFVPVGALNDQGLCLDMTMVEETDILLDSERPDYEGSYFLDLLRVCATVEEAKQWVRSYDLLILHWQQAHIADRLGDAVAIGLNEEGRLWMTNKTEDYLVTTNFNLAQNDGSHTSSGRYAATTNMLNEMDELSLDYCEGILEAVSMSSTMYSYIADLQHNLLYLYSRGDFERAAQLNVTEELSAGEHSYDIERLVSQQDGEISPHDSPTDAIGVIVGGSIIICTAMIVSIWIRRERI